MIERENTYLAKYLPKGYDSGRKKEILDIYLPASNRHPDLRIRKNGENYEITKKTLIDPSDSSAQREETIHLTKEEFEELSQLKGKRVRKIRYYYDFEGKTAEIDVFQDDLRGLVVVDFEFETEEEKNSFTMPEFCLADVTQEEFIAGGMVCGKTYKDLASELARFHYKILT